MPITLTPSTPSDHYASRGDVEAKIGVDNVKKLADLNANKDPDEIAARVEDALSEADADIDTELSLGNYQVPLTPTGGGTELPAWLDRYLRDIASDFTAHRLMSARDATQPVASDQRADIENRYTAAQKRLQRLIDKGIPNVVMLVDPLPDPGTVQFVGIDRGQCSADEFSGLNGVD